MGMQQAKQLADDLRERVKALGYDRYKLVVQVMEGPKPNLSSLCTALGSWLALDSGEIPAFGPACHRQRCSHSRLWSWTQ